ncbi:MAG: site-specific integrase, partial [Desulfovibrio sp.]|nr:site-specific integrase [Desulfovibrio sp.]
MKRETGRAHPASRAAASKGGASGRPPFSVADLPPHPLVDRYLEYLLISKGLSENSLRAYSQDLELFTRFLADRGADLSSVTDETIFLYLLFLRQRGLSSRSMARHLSALRGFYAFAADEGFVRESPAELVESPKLPRLLPEVLTTGEVERLLSAPDMETPLGFRDKAMLELLYATGIRVSELILLNVDDVNLSGGFVRCLNSRKERIIPLYPAAV